VWVWVWVWVCEYCVSVSECVHACALASVFTCLWMCACVCMRLCISSKLAAQHGACPVCLCMCAHKLAPWLSSKDLAFIFTVFAFIHRSAGLPTTSQPYYFLLPQSWNVWDAIHWCVTHHEWASSLVQFLEEWVSGAGLSVLPHFRDQSIGREKGCGMFPTLKQKNCA